MQEREREISKDPALLRPSPYQYLSLLYLSFWYLLPQLNSSFLPSSLSSVFWIYPETHFLPISLRFPEYSRAFPGYIPWLLKSLSSPLKSCPLAGLCPQRLPPSSLWYNHPRKSSWRGLPLKHTWSLDITVCIPFFHETVSVKASTVSPNTPPSGLSVQTDKHFPAKPLDTAGGCTPELLQLLLPTQGLGNIATVKNSNTEKPCLKKKTTNNKKSNMDSFTNNSLQGLPCPATKKQSAWSTSPHLQREASGHSTFWYTPKGSKLLSAPDRPKPFLGGWS